MEGSPKEEHKVKDMENRRDNKRSVERKRSEAGASEREPSQQLLETEDRTTTFTGKMRGKRPQ